MAKNFNIISKPWISEKATDLSKSGKYIFVVGPKATKAEVKKAVEAFYSVKVTGVNIVNTKPKQKRLGYKSGWKSGFKKAIVTLASGQTIDILPH